MKNTNLVIGKINTGKTTGVLFKEIRKSIENNENLFILDEKEEYYKTFKKELDNKGYKTYVLNLKDTKHSNSYNPLMVAYNYYTNNEFDKAIETIEELGLEIFKDDNSTNDPFWTNSAADYFTALTLILFKDGKKEEINLGSIYTLASVGEQEKDDTTIIKDYFDALNVNDTIYKVGSAIVYAPADTKGGILSTMKQKLNLYCIREQLLNNLCGNEIDLLNLNDKVAIFVINKNGLNSLSNVMIDQIANENINMTYYLDNIDNIPRIIELNNMLDNKLKIYIATRNKDDFSSKYGKNILDKFENIMENINVNDFVTIGDYNEYPISKDNEAKYFNIKNS